MSFLTSLVGWSSTETEAKKPKEVEKFVSAAEKRRYNFVPQLYDGRDIFAFTNCANATLPSAVDLRAQCPPVYDQGHLGSCTANAVAAAFQFDQMKQDEATFMPSRLFIYWNERFDDGDVPRDGGSTLREAAKTVAKKGVCPETMWPYDIAKFTEKPPQECYDEALKHRSVQYNAVENDLYELTSALAQGYPLIFGFPVYESFESKEVARTGIMPMPKDDEKLLGGHAVMLVGYDSDEEMFLVRNSWSDKWGLDGYFKMPFKFLFNYASDFWMITRVD